MRSSAFANPPPANRPAITVAHRPADRIPQTAMATQITTAIVASLVCRELESSPTKPKLMPVFTVYSKFRNKIPRSKRFWPFRSFAERISRITSALKIENISRLTRVAYRAILITFE